MSDLNKLYQKRINERRNINLNKFKNNNTYEKQFDQMKKELDTKNERLQNPVKMNMENNNRFFKNYGKNKYIDFNDNNFNQFDSFKKTNFESNVNFRFDDKIQTKINDNLITLNNQKSNKIDNKLKNQKDININNVKNKELLRKKPNKYTKNILNIKQNEKKYIELFDYGDDKNKISENDELVLKDLQDLGILN